MKNKLVACLLLTGIFLMISAGAFSQTKTVNLKQLMDSALRNNRLLNIRNLQVEEKASKVREDRIKQYPAVLANGNYLYNANIGQLTIPAGAIGSIPQTSGTPVLLPSKDQTYNLGEHNIFNAGLIALQPLTEQSRIRTGIRISKTDVLIAEKERDRTVRQIQQAIEKLYYGLLINQRQQEEAAARLEVAEIQLYDVESALLAGKAVSASQAGLQANAADEEQQLLRLQIEKENYLSDMRYLTGLPIDSVQLSDVDITATSFRPQEVYSTRALNENTDINIAALTKAKTDLAVKAAKQSNIPNVDIAAGYIYQQGNIVFPANNLFAGLSFRWNMQDLFSNKQVLKQRYSQQQQAAQNLANTREQVKDSVDKAYRKIAQQQRLIEVAQKVVTYRAAELKVQQDSAAAGLNKKADVLSVQAAFAKAKADLLSAQLAYRLAVSDLNVLSGSEPADIER